MKRTGIVVLLMSGLAVFPPSEVKADTYKCVDANGRPTYTNAKEEIKGKNCSVVPREINVVPAAPTRSKKETKQAQEERRLKVAALREAEAKAVITCRNKAACDKAFSLTQIYINQTSDQKIQIANDTIIETFNPTDAGKMGLKATRIPDKGTSASIKLTSACKGETYALDSCLQKQTKAYDGFRPFIASMLKE